MIVELTGQYRFLSNFWSCLIEWEGDTYPSVENAYQAAKCKHQPDRMRFLHCKASEAKRQGQMVPIRHDWEDIKLDVMYQLVKQKFADSKLAGLLIDTEEEEIQEGNWWGDRFWGTVNGVGQNNLGKILMKVREELRA